MSKLFSLIALLFLAINCGETANKEMSKSAKSSAASQRINSSASNSQDILKELDE